jgi:hypothetical protein
MLMRLDGATKPSRPNALAGMNVGNPSATTPAAFMNCLRLMFEPDEF